MDSCLELCAAINERVCGLLFDTWHWYTSEGTIEQVERLGDGQVVYIHVNDAPHGIPVEDQVDNEREASRTNWWINVLEVLQILVRNGVHAPVTVEPFTEELKGLSSDDAVRMTAEALQQVWFKEKT